MTMSSTFFALAVSALFAVSADPTASPTEPSVAPTASPTEVDLVSGNVCASGYTKVTSEIECRVALRLEGYLGENFQGSESDVSWPSGCYVLADYDDDGGTGIWFNTHASGNPKDAAMSLCVSTTNGFKQNKMIFDGDSDIDYMPADWATLYPTSYNVGVGGDTCADVVNRAPDIISVLQPSSVVIICGENDLASGSDVDTAFSRFTAAVALYNAAGVEVIYIGTKPEPDTTSLHSEYIQYDKKIKAYTADRQLTMIDLYNSFEDLGNPSTLYRTDKLHMSLTGYSYVAGWLDIELADTSECNVWRSDTCTQDDTGEINDFPSLAPTAFSPISTPTDIFSDELSGASIAGIVIASLVILTALIGGVLFWMGVFSKNDESRNTVYSSPQIEMIPHSLFVTTD